jgi:NAD-dependent dihydropyrimidine dehydrogenase PreA subunit
VDIDDRLIVVDADACTGCRLCEILCPDFAISIGPPLEAAVARSAAEGIGLR